jgi:lysine 6-dehydrogenase
MNATGGVKIVVIGGAGAMGRITVRDLVETAASDVEIVIADYNDVEAKRLAKSFARKVEARRADVTNVRSTAQLLKGAFAVINCTQFEHNLKVMTAALQAGAHYTDLGGLFHMTRRQLDLGPRFENANLLALLGMGAAPGITNVLARSAADTMSEVHEIHTLVGTCDRTPDRPLSPMGVSYSIQTVLDEASQPAALFTAGKLSFVDPLSGAEPVHFPEPVGVRRPAYTLHSEVATLPYSYAAKGIREVSFKIAFSEALDEKLRFLRTIGMLSDAELKVGRAKVSPRQVLLRALAKLEREAYEGVPDEYEIVRAVVRGLRGKQRVEETVDCHVPGIPSWGFGADVDTGCPPSIAMQMLLRGQITARGSVPAELAIPAEPFFAELLRRGMTVRRRVVAREEAAPALVESRAPSTNGQAVARALSKEGGRRRGKRIAPAVAASAKKGRGRAKRAGARA